MGNIYLIPQDVLTQYIFLTNTGRNEEAYALLKKNKHRLGMITNVGDKMAEQKESEKKSEVETDEETMQNMVDSENDSDDTTEGDEDESPESTEGEGKK